MWLFSPYSIYPIHLGTFNNKTYFFLTAAKYNCVALGQRCAAMVQNHRDNY